jgi:hypothetical protein
VQLNAKVIRNDGAKFVKKKFPVVSHNRALFVYRTAMERSTQDWLNAGSNTAKELLKT